MKSYIMYVCETCGFECKDGKEMMKHEADHLGLTAEELETYNSLKSYARYIGSVISKTNNNETREKFDKAIEDLMAFEKVHNIKELF